MHRVGVRRRSGFACGHGRICSTREGSFLVSGVSTTEEEVDLETKIAEQRGKLARVYLSDASNEVVQRESAERDKLYDERRLMRS